MPQMGTSVVEGTVVAWTKAIGDTVAEGEIICEISSDKVDTECPSPITGVLAEIVAEEGATVDVGGVIARLAVEGGAPAAPAPDTSAPVTSTPESPAAPAGDVPPGPAHAQLNGNGRSAARVSPVVARMVQTHALDLAAISGTGRGGRVTKQDVLAFLDRAAPEPMLHSESPYRPDSGASLVPVTPPPPPPAAPVVTAAPDELGGVSEPLSRMRMRIGAAMRNSLDTAATCTTVVECDMSTIERRRRQLGLTALPLLARHTIDVLLGEFPGLNAKLDGTTITRFDRVHLGIAVSLGEDGLIVPVIHDAQDLSPEGLGKRIRDLAAQARTKRLTPDDVRGATFTITNPGAFGALIATPVIDVPQVAILDLEAIVRRPVVVTDANGGESIAIRPMVNLCLGWDHRALDGGYAAQFLTALRRRVEAS